jgi:hypothetical protein
MILIFMGNLELRFSRYYAAAAQAANALSRPSRRADDEIHVDLIVGKHDPAVVGAFQHPGLEQGLHVAVDRFHVAFDTLRDRAWRAVPRPGRVARLSGDYQIRTK